MFDITEHSANPSTFAKHILSVMDLSLEDQSILLQGQHSPLLLTQLLEGLLSLSLPFSAAAEPIPLSKMSEHIVQLIHRIAQPLSLTLLFKKPSKFDSYQLKPFVGTIEVQAVDCVCDGGHTFATIREYCQSLLSSSSAASLPFWSLASRIVQ